MMKLNRLFLSQNISVDNALSMNQILHQIVNQIKEIVDFINNLELRANEYTDQEILKLKNNLESQLAVLEQTLKTYTNDKIDEYNLEVINPQLTEIRNTIDNVNQLLNNRIDREVGILNRKIDSVESSLIVMLNDTKEYLEELIRKGNQLVYSGVSGKKIPIQDALKEIANASKQMLSYNWNTIDLLKTISVDTTGYTLINNNYSFYSKILEQSSDIPWTLNITNYNDIECLSVSSPVPSLDFVIKLDDVSILNECYTEPGICYIPLTLLNNIIQELYIKIGGNFKKYSILKYISTKITFDSIKSQMQNTDIEIRPNWNGLVFDGVNGWNILANVGGLYDDDSFVNPLWNELPYKNNVYRNENSEFYNQIETEGE